MEKTLSHFIGGGGGGAGGLSPPRFSPENMGNTAQNWFGKIFRLVIFSQIVSQWSCLVKYYFLELFEKLHPNFERPINCCLFPINSETAGFPLTQQQPSRLWEPVKCKAKTSYCIRKMNCCKSENKNSAHSYFLPICRSEYNLISEFYSPKVQ